MIRFHLSPEDLVRTRFAAGPAPLLEMSTSLLALCRPRLAKKVPWGRQICAEMRGPALDLLDLIPPDTLSPLFLDPPATDLEEGLHLVRTAPSAQIEAELAERLPNGAKWLQGLPSGDDSAWHRLERALLTFTKECLAPHWAEVATAFSQDVAYRSQLLVTQGLAGVFNSFGPQLRWQDGILFLEHPRDLDIHLDGRGLELLPTAHWPGRPLLTRHPDGTQILMYAVTPTASPTTSGLPTVLGATRTAVLRELLHPCSTRQLAARLSISEASASRHVALLRTGGMATTTREGKSVRHALTPLGHAILAHRNTSLH